MEFDVNQSLNFAPVTLSIRWRSLCISSSKVKNVGETLGIHLCWGCAVMCWYKLGYTRDKIWIKFSYVRHVIYISSVHFTLRFVFVPGLNHSGQHNSFSEQWNIYWNTLETHHLLKYLCLRKNRCVHSLIILLTRYTSWLAFNTKIIPLWLMVVEILQIF